MRIVTRKIYRAFPDLDTFSDDQCEHYVRRVTKSFKYIIVTAPAVMAAFGVGGIIGILIVVSATAVLDDLRARAPQPSIVEMMLLLFSVCLIIMMPALSALRVRDHMLWRFVRSQVGRARCLQCDYSLLGQRIVNSIITCPECGRATTLQELGLSSPDELIAPGQTQPIQLQGSS